MSRRYHHPILVRLKDDRPYSFDWRGATYRVRAILATWHLRDRWWSSSSAFSAPSPVNNSAYAGNASGQVQRERRESDRIYYRLECDRDLLCEVYHDLASGLWILDQVCD